MQRGIFRSKNTRRHLADPLGELKRSPYLLATKRGKGREGEGTGGKGKGRG